MRSGRPITSPRALPVALALVASLLAPEALAQRRSAVAAPALPPAEPAPGAPAERVPPSTLVVEVFDEHGAPLDTPAPFVVPTEAGALLGGSSAVEGATSFLTRPGAVCSVGVFARDRGLVERGIVAGGPGATLRTQLHLGPAVEPVKLVADVREPTGYSGGLKLTFHSLRSGRTLLATDVALEGGRWRGPINVPPGTYVVRATPSNGAWYLPSQEVVDVSAGPAGEVALTPVLGGQVRFRLDETLPWRTTAHALTPEGRRIQLAVSSQPEGGWSLTTRSALPAGETALELHVPGFRDQRVPVRVRAGTRVDVAVELEREP